MDQLSFLQIYVVIGIHQTHTVQIRCNKLKYCPVNFHFMIENWLLRSFICQ